MAKKFINIKFLCVAMLLWSTGFGQTIKEELATKLQANMDAVWNESDANFSPRQEPEKWAGFSAVIIAQKQLAGFARVR